VGQHGHTTGSTDQRDALRQRHPRHGHVTRLATAQILVEGALQAADRAGLQQPLRKVGALMRLGSPPASASAAS